MGPRASRKLGYASLAVTVAVWGTAYPIIDVAERYVSPVALAALRTLVGGAVLAAISRRLIINRRTLVAGFINIGAFLILLNLSIVLSPNPSLAAVMIYAQPLFTAIATPYVLHRKISGLQYAGVLIGMAGIGVLTAVDSRGLNMGLLLGLLGAILWSAGTMYFEKYVASDATDLVGATAFMSLASTPLVLAFWPLGMYIKLTLESIVMIVYITLVIQAVGWLTWFYGVRSLGGVRAGAFSMVTPVIAIASTALLLGKVLAPTEVAASAAVILGATLVQLA
ncbi:DMT family transporter [Acidilobus sp.]|uniref:DMT family transporter n=1 Tax=Acidilobus sp. TaxID=1872109 RepID=UPI003D058164